MSRQSTEMIPIHRGMTFGFYARNGYYGTAEAPAAEVMKRQYGRTDR